MYVVEHILRQACSDFVLISGSLPHGPSHQTLQDLGNFGQHDLHGALACWAGQGGHDAWIGHAVDENQGVTRHGSLLSKEAALEQWEDRKRLEKRVDSLKAKLKVCCIQGACKVHVCLEQCIHNSCLLVRTTGLSSARICDSHLHCRA